SARERGDVLAGADRPRPPGIDADPPAWRRPRRDAAGGADVPATVLVIEIIHGRAPVDRGTFVARQFDIEAVAEWLPHEGPAARQVVALRPCLDITAEEQLPEVVQLEVVAERGIHPGI